MLFENPYIFFFCALGVFNCFIVSIYFLFLRKRPQAKHTLFGLLTLLLSIRIGKTLYMSFSDSQYLWIAHIGLSACFLIGVTLYHYLKASLENRQSISTSWVIHIGIVLLVILSVGLIAPYESSIPFWHTYFVWFIYLVWGGYLILSAYELRDVLHEFSRSPKQSSTSDTWLILVFIGNVLIFLSYLIGYFWLYLVEMLTFSIMFYGLVFYFLARRDRDSIFGATSTKYTTKKINTSEANGLIERLAIAMTEEQLYKNPNLKLRELSSQINITQHKL